ncbi:hypothetical protein O181_056631 [Austropuccinia psidii MF-1]|uniref:DUF5009 domain-containing protein n=1 Tax=Austropuccinia psidii MF-1 TaxID=1389203 RepID=A0A9Q3E6P8_9BASI|nr:hypothetical protein [Austropuccinia psidii MF-1]
MKFEIRSRWPAQNIVAVTAMAEISCSIKAMIFWFFGKNFSFLAWSLHFPAPVARDILGGSSCCRCCSGFSPAPTGNIHIPPDGPRQPSAWACVDTKRPSLRAQRPHSPGRLMVLAKRHNASVSRHRQRSFGEGLAGSKLFGIPLVVDRQQRTGRSKSSSPSADRPGAPLVDRVTFARSTFSVVAVSFSEAQSTSSETSYQNTIRRQFVRSSPTSLIILESKADIVSTGFPNDSPSFQPAQNIYIQAMELSSNDPSSKQASKRDRSVDILRGFTCFSMILVNSAGSVRPSWLSHAVSLSQPITFADTLFPCFVFTSGLAEAVSIGNPNDPNPIRKAALRAIKLVLLGIGYNNVLPRLISPNQPPLLELSTWRIPSVLSRHGLSSLVGSFESVLNLRPPIFPAVLALIWYLLAGRQPFQSPSSTAQAKLDRFLWGSRHLYDPKAGFDPEGFLATQAISIALLGVCLTGLLPSPSAKMLWTPTFVGQTTCVNLLYWTCVRIFATTDSLILDALEMLGRRSLEIYFLSSGAQLLLERARIWPWIEVQITFWLNSGNCVAGVVRSTFLAIAMVPIAKVLVKNGWRLRF